MVWEGQIFISQGQRPAFASIYFVQVLEVGAQVAQASSGTTVTVAEGHGFAADDKLIVNLDITQYRVVQSVTATTLVLTQALSVAEDDRLVNLAQDTGPTAPNYNGNGLTVYTDMDYQDAAVRNTVRTDVYGRYRYYHVDLARWELIRSSAGPVDIRQYAASTSGPSDNVSTDNAVVLWDGVDASRQKNSVVLVNDNGDVSGVGELACDSLVVDGDTGTSTLQVTNGAYVGGTATVVGATSLSTVAVSGTATVVGATSLSTLAVSGASTLTGAVGCGAVTSTGAIRTSGANGTLGTMAQVSALITLSTTTTDTAGLLPANSLILGVCARVTTTITGATSWQLGISGTPGRFTIVQSGAQLTAGATVVGMEHLRGDSVTQLTGPTQAAAGTLRVTTVGTPTGGVIRVTVYYITFGAPTS